MSAPAELKIIQLQPEEAQQLFQRIEPRIDPADFQLIVEVFNAVPQVLEYLAHKDITVNKLRRMLFGVSSEKSGLILPNESSNPSDPAPKPDRKAPKKRPGHGRNGSKDYPGASVVAVTHPQFHPGDSCPSCKDGHLHLLKEPAKVIHILAQPIFPATLFNLEQLRCGRCGEVFTAPPPPEAGNSKYDPKVGCQLGLMHYEYGMPMTRIQTVQANLGVPLPIGTQWQLMANTAKDLAPVHAELERQAAQSPIFHTKC